MHRMATQKRRVVYLSDEAWETAKSKAAKRGLSISAYIQSHLVVSAEDRARIEQAQKEFADTYKPDKPVMAFTPMTQAERDAILRRVNKG